MMMETTNEGYRVQISGPGFSVLVHDKETLVYAIGDAITLAESHIPRLANTLAEISDYVMSGRGGCTIKGDVGKAEVRFLDAAESLVYAWIDHDEEFQDMK